MTGSDLNCQKTNDRATDHIYQKISYGRTLRLPIEGNSRKFASRTTMTCLDVSPNQKLKKGKDVSSNNV